MASRGIFINLSLGGAALLGPALRQQVVEWQRVGPGESPSRPEHPAGDHLGGPITPLVIALPRQRDTWRGFSPLQKSGEVLETGREGASIHPSRPVSIFRLWPEDLLALSYLTRRWPSWSP
jgi:hypothetical protein